MGKRKATMKCATCGRWLIVWGASQFARETTRWKHAANGATGRRFPCSNIVPVPA